MQNFVRQALTRVIRRQEKLMLRNISYVIISNNCWGAEVYRWLEKEYNTPFVGLFMHGPCYLKLLNNFDVLIRKEISFIDKSVYLNEKPAYPIGLIGDIEIHFMHYHDEHEAKQKWDRRVKRMLEEVNFDHYYFKICDRDGVSTEIMEQFHSLPFKNKISFSVKELGGTANHVVIRNGSQADSVPDGVILYKMSFKYVDIIEWIRKQIITTTLKGRLKARTNIS